MVFTGQVIYLILDQMGEQLEWITETIDGSQILAFYLLGMDDIT